MTYTLFVLFSCLSFVWTVSWCCCVFKKSRRGKISGQTLPAVALLTVGLFVSVWLVLLPAYYFTYDYGDSYGYLRPFWLSLLNTMKVFILDGEYEFTVQAAADFSSVFHILYTLYTAILFVAAPVLTFGNVLYLFKNFNGEIRFKRCVKRPIYIMSELNERSVTLAKSIQEENTGKKSLIVFTDVSQQDEEDKYELVLQARNMKAVCLKKGASDLDLKNKRGNVEIFLIGENESENVSQAVSLTNALNERNSTQKIKIFAFANSVCSSYIINSLRYDNLLDNAREKNYGEDAFKLRRVDDIRQLVWNEVQKMRLFETAKDNTVSILLIGIGRYGMEFLKTLFWYCQADGFRLEINIVDKIGNSGDRAIESVIERSCPELLCYKERYNDVDMDYSIKCFSGVDMNTDAFRRMLEYSGSDSEKLETAQRLRRTAVAIVAMGGDDINIETSVYLRMLYDKIGGITADSKIKTDDERPQIYTVVYDELKSSQGDRGFLINHKEIPYNIHFIGSFSSQYSYKNVYDKDIEAEALKQHTSWITVKQAASDRLKEAGSSDAEISNAGFDIAPQIAEETHKFQRFEYFRLSSVASCIHDRAMKKYFPDKLEDNNGEFREKSEHMRWNAYMLANGYEYGSRRAERARIHNNIKPWSQLNDFDKQKDK